MKNYFDHDIKVKFFDNILEHSDDWQWFIDEIEKEFEGFGSISSFQEFLCYHAKIKDVYAYLIKLHNSIGEVKINFTKNWLKQINLCVQIFCGSQQINDIWELLDSDFIKLFAIVAHVTKLQNINVAKPYIFSALVFMQNNVFELFDLSAIKEEENFILRLLKEVKIDDIQEITTRFQNNLREVSTPANLAHLDKFKDKILNVNAFSFQRLELPQDISWEDQYIFDMLQTEISENKLTPFMTFNGVSTPDITLWTEDILEKLSKYFNNAIASFIIETVWYILYKKVPSNETIKLHFNLVINDLKSKNDTDSWYNIKSSSLLFLGLLLNGRCISNDIKNLFMQPFTNELSRFKEPGTISSFKEHGIWVSQEQQKILCEYNSNLANRIIEVENPYELIDYCKNNFVASGIKNDSLKLLFDKFNVFLEQANNSVEISMLFYSVMQLMLKLLNNRYVDKSQIKNAMIWLQQQWQSIYYDKCVGLMHSIGSSITVSNDEITILNKAFIERTVLVALYCFPIKKDKLIELMSMHSQAVISLFCQPINITRTFPFENRKKLERHDVDNAFVQIISNIIDEKGYKLLNYIEPEVLFNEIYNDFMRNTQMYMAMFNQEKVLYEKVKEMLPEYSLIEYDGHVFLAHLTQLFPILENKIREFGAYCNIVPFKEKADEFMHMKDANSVLQQILMEVYSETKDFLHVVDLFFIYQCMYNGNCLNIRNECSHGREYVSSNGLSFGFKTTLVCLKIILDRLNQIKSSE